MIRMRIARLPLGRRKPDGTFVSHPEMTRGWRTAIAFAAFVSRELWLHETAIVQFALL
jgi:hypothetical protein